MRSRHASMSFITSVEARNTPKLPRNYSITVANYVDNSLHLKNFMRLMTSLRYHLFFSRVNYKKYELFTRT